ncbi:MAG: efflux RND transporter permease subunit [Candidatus Moranbacteria bacterium]|jgi:multidrug efflux pump subunit AcrB|nr:efflux RND transporter permease subunit [Candidatus Moranbacteria bacterium]
MIENSQRENRFFKKVANVFITNKELGILTILFLIFFGVLGFVLMPKQYNPEIVAPAFRINTVFPNATAEEVYELVTRPMENKVREITLVDDIYSQSTMGFSSVTVTFDIGSDEQDAKIDLVQRLRSNMGEKPLGVQEPSIEEIDVDDVPILSLALISDKFSPEALRSFALDFSDRLKHIENVGKIVIRGGERADLSVSVDVDKLQFFNISIQDVYGAIVSNNQNVLATKTDSFPYDIPVEVYGSIENIEQLKKIVITKSDNQIVRIEDVSEVKVGQIIKDNYVRFEEKNYSAEAVLMGIAKQNGANATTVAKEIHQEIDKLKNQNFIPEYVQIKITGDDGAVASESISGLTINLIQSVMIVILVLLLFLNTRSALVVAVAIPLSLLSVFGLGMLFGQTINRITLFALILSLGLLVDNATVVVENIYRLLKLNLSVATDGLKMKNKKKEVVIVEAVAEVSSGLIMSTVTTVLAFIPMAFVTGMMGPYMGPIPFFVPLAIVGSLLIALTINPFIANLILKVEDEKRGPLARVQKQISKLVVWIENKYADFLKNVFGNKKKEKAILMVVVILLLISLSLPLFQAVKFRMLPKADRDQFFIYLDANYGTDLERTNQVAQMISREILNSSTEIKNIQTSVGIAPIADFNGLFKGSDGRTLPYQATLKINLISNNERQKTSEDIAEKVRENIAPLASRENVQVKIIEDPPGPPVLATYQLKAQGENREDYLILRDIAKELSRKSQQIGGVVDVDVSQNEYGVRETYRVNVEKASQLGVSVKDIFATMELSSQGANVSLYHDTLTNEQKFSEQHYISLRSKKDDLGAIENINQINVRNQSGALVALNELLEKIELPIDDTILMDAQYPTVYVSGEMEGRSVVYASIDMLSYLVKEYRLPSGKGEVDSWNLFGVNYIDVDGTRYNVRIGGEWELTLEVFRDMGVAFLVAIFLIYFVLVAQFQSLKIPLYIMATIPFSLIGVLPGFMVLYFLKGTYFNATSMIGVIALAGIVVNNAIIYLEYVFQEQDKGVELETALIEAGRTRLLPIALTSLTTVLGSLTIISDPVWEGLAWAIITGLSFSVILTLVILPMLYRRFESKNYNN